MREVAGQVPENPEELVSRIVRRVVGDVPTTVQNILGRGFNNAVSVAETNKGRFVVRTNVESHLFRFEREARCFRLLSDRGVPVPQVIECGIESGTSFSVAPFLEGTYPVDFRVDPLDVWRKIGRYAAVLNSIRPEDVGTVDEIRRLFPFTWEEQVTTDLRLIFGDSAFWQVHGGLSEAHQKTLESYLLQRAAKPQQLGLCQFDLSVDNVLLSRHEPQQIVFLDLEWANIAPVPGYQISCVAGEHGLNSETVNVFLQGYGCSGCDREFGTELFAMTFLRALRATVWARDRAPHLVDANVSKVMPYVKQWKERSGEPDL